ncbi:hypothetical protein Lal_00012791 [Lupinus albus]|nr:hypothetical protein Lal_00012791 [Lupinus albus]
MLMLFKISEQNHKKASNPIYPYRASRMGYRGVEEKILEQSETPLSVAADLDILWVDARKNKQGVVDNEKVQEAVNRVVTLKERESFYTAGSQYPVSIHDVGFGASKQFVTPSTKCLTKADAAVLQDKYDSLAERFHAMEKRMEAGKFVEGHEASTTVKESFTHPRNHIPIPKGIINNCKLFLHTPCTREVAIGMVYNTQDAIIHHAQIPSNHLKVSIDISIEDDALMPIPVDEDIITIGLALATFVGWPKHLIDLVPIMGKVSVDDHSATSLPIIDELASKKAKVVKSKPQSSKSNLESSRENLPADSTFNISFHEPIYGFPTEEFITINDVKDVHGRDWIGASVLSVYIRYLYDIFVPKSKKKVMFISPQANILGAGMVPNDTWKKQKSQIVANILDQNKEIADLFFAPLNTGQQRILVVINRDNHQLFYFDALKNGDPNKYPVIQDIFNTALNTYKALHPKRQRPVKWIHVKTPHQNNNKYCGFYVINFIMEQPLAKLNLTLSTSKIIHTFNIENHSRIEPQNHSRIQHQNLFLSFNPKSSLILHRIESEFSIQHQLDKPSEIHHNKDVDEDDSKHHTNEGDKPETPQESLIKMASPFGAFIFRLNVAMIQIEHMLNYKDGRIWQVLMVAYFALTHVLAGLEKESLHCCLHDFGKF